MPRGRDLTGQKVRLDWKVIGPAILTDYPEDAYVWLLECRAGHRKAATRYAINHHKVARCYCKSCVQRREQAEFDSLSVWERAKIIELLL
jgi:hypothetical protein